jgi:peptide/nickel transport system ATP-binding protein
MTDSPSEAANTSRTERLRQRDPVLDVRNLRVEFPSVKQPVVEEISFALQPGQTLGIVGESGSGKSITSLAVMGLLPNPGKVTQGEVWFRGNESESIDLLTLLPSQLSAYRGEQMAMIFQEPMSSLNPVFTIGYLRLRHDAKLCIYCKR